MGPPLLALLFALPAARPVAPPLPAAPVGTVEVASDEQVFRAAQLDPAGPAVLDFFRGRTAPPAREQLAELVKQLAGPASGARDGAAAALVRAGPAAVPLLRPAANAVEDLEAAARARRCLECIEGQTGANLARAAVRLVATQKPAGAAAVLLAYLPLADDANVTQEVETALAAVGVTDGKPDAALLAALSDAAPVRRAAAAAVLCRAGGAAQFAAVRPLLKDARPTVRLRVALGLANAHEAEAIPVLIDLLADGAPTQRKAAEAFLVELAGEWALATPQGNDGMASRLRREAWAAWWRGVDGEALLAEFRSRTLSDPDLERMQVLVQQLDDESASVRDKAVAGLIELGLKAGPLLRRAARTEGRAGLLATRCLEAVEGERPRPLPAAACRLLTLRRPPGTLETLLAYLPSADSDDVAAQVTELLPALGVRDGKAEPALVAAIGDRVAVRRAAAAGVLCKAGLSEHFPAVRKLLQDPDSEVRLRAALALAGAREKDAVPVLVALLGELPRADQAWEAEDYLLQLAGDKAPAAPWSADAAGRAKSRDAWAAWWKENAARVDLARIEEAPKSLGYLLAVEMWNPAGGAGRVVEVDGANKVRWQIMGLAGPQDAQVLRGDKVLIAEQNANRVTERDFAGKVLWERAVNQAFQVQRLRNGNTFIAGRNLLIEVDRTGKEVFTLQRPDYLLSARRFRDGQIAFFTNQGNYVRLDAAGKEIKSIRIGTNRNMGISAAEVLPGDRVLVSVQQFNKVMEYDGDGKVAWEATVPMAGNATRLPNGHTLVVQNNSTNVTELDRAGKVVAERRELPVRPWRAGMR